MMLQKWHIQTNRAIRILTVFSDVLRKHLKRGRNGRCFTPTTDSGVGCIHCPLGTKSRIKHSSRSRCRDHIKGLSVCEADASGLWHWTSHQDWLPSYLRRDVQTHPSTRWMWIFNCRDDGPISAWMGTLEQSTAASHRSCRYFWDNSSEGRSNSMWAVRESAPTATLGSIRRGGEITVCSASSTCC